MADLMIIGIKDHDFVRLLQDLDCTARASASVAAVDFAGWVI